MKKIRNCPLLLLTVILSLAGCKKTDFAAQQQANSTLLPVGDYIRNNFDFTILTAALQKTGLMDTLNRTDSSFTLFAPDDNAFHVDSILTVSDLDKFSIDSLKFLIRNHIMRGKLFSSDIPTALDNLYPNLNGLNLYVSSNTTATVLAVSGAPMEQIQTATNSTGGIVFDIPLANGVVHVMDRPLKYYNGTVQAFLASRPELSLLVSGLKKFGLWDSLGTANPYTIMAPVDSAFTMNHLTADSITAMDTGRIQSILFGGCIAYPHHVFISDEGMVSNTPLLLDAGYTMSLSSGVSDNAPGGAALGPLKNNLPDNRYSPFLNAGSTDFVCSNGVVHLLSQLLILPSDVPK